MGKTKTIVKRIIFIVALCVILAACVVAFMFTPVNYTLTDYLPQDAPTIQGLKLMEEQYGSNSFARVMLKGINVVAAAEIKKSIANIEGVKYTLWLDDIIGMAIQPLKKVFTDETVWSGITSILEKLGIKQDSAEYEFFLKLKDNTLTDEEILGYLDSNAVIMGLVDVVMAQQFNSAILLSNYYDTDNKNALIEVYFIEGDYSQITNKALNQIYELTKESNVDAYFTGTAVTAKSARDTTSSQALQSTLVVIPFIFLILFLTTTSVFEPLLFLIVIGVSVLLNFGTNIIFVWTGVLKGISFITTGMAAALQMAISMDYSIFFLHRFKEEKLTCGGDINLAVKRTIKASVAPLLASCLTTVAGFVALSFMQFKIGLDIGLVFAKGIILSFLCVFALMPMLVKMFDKPIEKYQHRSFLPRGEKLSKTVMRFAVVIVCVIVAVGVGAFSLQGNLTFLYGESAVGSSEGTKTYDDMIATQEYFGIYNPVAIILPISIRSTATTNNREVDLITKLNEISYEGRKMVKSIMAYRSIVPVGSETMAQEEMGALIGNFDSEEYTRMIVVVDALDESPAANYTLQRISSIVTEIQPKGSSIVGTTVAANDLKTIIEADYDMINLIAIIAVAAIIMIMFKSIIMPILLVSSIEIGIFINMAIGALGGAPMAFLGYLVVSLIQLGATIDYAILLGQNYVDARKTMPRIKATMSAMRQSLPSILTSAGILAVAGFVIGTVSSVAGVAQIGIMIGRGALISGALVLTFLPALLSLCDGLITRLSSNMVFYNVSKLDIGFNENDINGTQSYSSDSTTTAVKAPRQKSQKVTKSQIKRLATHNKTNIEDTAETALRDDASATIAVVNNSDKQANEAQQNIAPQSTENAQETAPTKDAGDDESYQTDLFAHIANAPDKKNKK